MQLNNIRSLLKKSKLIQFLYKRYNSFKREQLILRKINQSDSLKIVFGASGRFDNGWIPTDIDNLNLLEAADWEKYFQPNSIDAMLAEHVWEHLTIEDASTALQYCFEYLKDGGYFRLAVPDGYHPDPTYIDYVKVNGFGPGSDDHKVLYTYKTLQTILENAGFKVKLLEYFDENGKFHFEEWDVEQGKILRSKRFDRRNKDGSLSYTSLIVDAYKP